MRVPRIFLPDPLALGCQVNLTGESFHYVVRVLRLQPGAKLILFNGHGGQFPGLLLRRYGDGGKCRYGKQGAQRKLQAALRLHRSNPSRMYTDFFRPLVGRLWERIVSNLRARDNIIYKSAR